MKWLVVGIAVVLMPLMAGAQELELKVNIDKARFEWNAGQGGGPVDGYRLTCGLSSGVYEAVSYTTPDTRLTVPVSEVIKVPGSYYCVVQAVNKFDVSDKSNEVGFTAGHAPPVPVGFRLVAE